MRVLHKILFSQRELQKLPEKNIISIYAHICNYAARIIYAKAFPMNSSPEDQAFIKKILEMQNSILSQLDIKPSYHHPEAWKLAIKCTYYLYIYLTGIKKAEHKRTPKDIIKCFEEGLKLISNSIQEFNMKKEFGADEIMPIMVYVTARAMLTRIFTLIQ